MRIERKRKG